ncbi:MAG: AMP-binding protein [Cyanobacteria bacterium P01_F01_bin.53]
MSANMSANVPTEIRSIPQSAAHQDAAHQDAAYQATVRWVPTEEDIQHTHIADWQKQLNLDSYPALHKWSIEYPMRFWERVIGQLGIHFQQRYLQLLDLSKGIEKPQWLVGARMNIAQSCFLAPAEATAIVFQRPGETLESWQYGTLEKLTNRVANGLAAMGIQKGDAIAIDLPMSPASVAIYLGIIKLGGIVVAIADSFAPEEISVRLKIAGTQSPLKAIFTQDVIWRKSKVLPLYAKVIAAQSPCAIVLNRQRSKAHGWEPQPLRSGDVTWEDFLSDNDQFEAIACAPNEFTHILFSSGTTGDPKAIPWDHTTPIKCATDGHLHHDIHPTDVVAWPTNLGWMMGPWLIYASLINQATIALYGDSPSDRSFGEFVQNARVSLLGVVPSLVKTWKHSQCMNGLDWSAIRALSSTGECSNPEDMAFLMALAGHKPVIEYCGGTEIGGAYLTGTLVQPALPSSFTTPALGLDIVILDETRQPSTVGEAFIVGPSIGLSTELLNRDHHNVYFENTPRYGIPRIVLRRHGDRIEQFSTEGTHYYRAQGRTDDTMNLSGIKVSAAEIERIIQPLDSVKDVAAIALNPSTGGPSQLVLYVVPKSKSPLNREHLFSQIQQQIRQRLNPLFKLHDLVIINALPRTASQKVMRRKLRENHPLREN